MTEEMERSKNHREWPEKMERSEEEERKGNFASNPDEGERYTYDPSN